MQWKLFGMLVAVGSLTAIAFLAGVSQAQYGPGQGGAAQAGAQVSRGQIASAPLSSAHVGASRVSQQASRGEGLIAFSSELDDRQQMLTVIDPVARVMSVYHVNRASGEITLKSVRNLHWDLMVEQFNGASPSPKEIRALLQVR